MTGPDTPNRFSDTFAANPGDPPRGLLPEARVWATVTGAAVLVGAVVLLVPLLSAGSGHGGGPDAVTVADAARTPAASTPPAVTATTPSATTTPTPAATSPSAARPAAPMHTTAATGGTSPSGTSTDTSTDTSTHRTTTSAPRKATTAPTKAADPVPPPKSAVSTVYNPNSGKCLSGSAGSDGTPLKLWTCNGNANQQWTFASDGTIRTKGLCMDAAWGGTADGTILQIADCSGNPAQQFALGSDGLIHAKQSGKCVDLWQGDTADGAAIKLYQCTGTWGQLWNRR
ncbi:RICIN domain-containing protein [Streptomyces sp. NPDC001832]|uniref:RICIN domain-containing protein n=1 Tax=Streptomyces sp. NPDC001832 TaxID=3154527 RepID=UPI00331F40F9